MAQLDDLKAVLADVSAKVDAVGVEVADLIAKLSTVPPPTDLTEVIGLAQSIAELEAIMAQLDDLKAVLADVSAKAIPPEP